MHINLPAESALVAIARRSGRHLLASALVATLAARPAATTLRPQALHRIEGAPK